MTIPECIKEKGIQLEVDSLKNYQTVDIGFVNSEGKEDETEFNVSFIGTKAGTKELTELFSDFCRECGFRNNTVYSVTVVKSSYRMKELE